MIFIDCGFIGAYFNPLYINMVVCLFYVSVVGAPCTVFLLMIFIASWYYNGGQCTLKDKRNTLLIIAHPDDESMFFGPTVLQLLSSGQRVKILCLSEGNYYGQGSIRRVELIKACSVLGLPKNDITLIDDKELPDDPKRVWPNDVIGRYVMQAVKSDSINRIITFDDRGVSLHCNHIAIHNAVRMLDDSGHLPGIEILYLRTVCICRKYLSFLSPLVIARPPHVCVSSINMWHCNIKALSKHSSQMTWYRQLYRWTSSYLITNSYILKKQQENNNNTEDNKEKKAT